MPQPPELCLDPALAPILAELRAAEEAMHWPAPGTPLPEVEALLAPDFWETGASGHHFGKPFVMEVLAKRQNEPPPPHAGSDYWCKRLAGEVYLLTYHLLQGNRPTRRMSIWERTPGGWKIHYHQGTVINEWK